MYSQKTMILAPNFKHVRSKWQDPYKVSYIIAYSYHPLLQTYNPIFQFT